MDIEKTLANLGIIAIVADRALTLIGMAIAKRRGSRGANLGRAFETTTAVTQDLYKLYEQLQQSDNFHSLRLLIAHNSGTDLSKTLLWKSSILASYPADHVEAGAWQEQPLDMEYLKHVLRPVADQEIKVTRVDELAPDGALGAIYRKHGVVLSVSFLIKRTNSEIVYASASFRTETITPADRDAIRICSNEARRRFPS
ncbi:MAG: hypothetical protein ACO1RT_16150 [Planctomycetaceae bacterium]